MPAQIKDTFDLREVKNKGQEYQRKLHPDDVPLKTQQERIRKGESCHFLVRRNPNYPRRRQLLPLLNETEDILIPTNSSPKSPVAESSCKQCQSNFKSCEFCNIKSALISSAKSPNSAASALQSYHPVYNVREIRTSSHSFSSLGIDKKLLDIQLSHRNSTIVSSTSDIVRPQSVHLGSRRKCIDDSCETDINGNTTTNSTTLSTTKGIVGEVVNNNPSKGLGHFVYI
uniref:Ras-associating domain-containing protein n=1 Tax=Megaselia scalaris TaxID=36166 RepID=T1GZD8_MEGSC